MCSEKLLVSLDSTRINSSDDKYQLVQSSSQISWLTSSTALSVPADLSDSFSVTRRKFPAKFSGN